MKVVKALSLLTGTLLMCLTHAASAQCNDYDLMLLCDSATMTDIAISSAGLSCAFDTDPAGCFIEEATILLPTMSAGCIDCFSQQANCALNNCATICAFGSSEACDDCIYSNCQTSFEACAEIVDQDNDGENNICDCDDNNPLQYPGAPGTNQGIDNNCNGLMEVSEMAELGCPADLSGDGIVGAADLVIFLGFFGCMENCGDTDLDEDGLVGVSDLVVLLGQIGQFCQ